MSYAGAITIAAMHELFTGVPNMALLEIAALFPIVNPVGTAPIFLSLTRGASAQTRTTLAGKIAVNGFVLLVVSMLVGSYILAFFGISLPVVQVAGGLVLTSTGWSLPTYGVSATMPERSAEAVAPSPKAATTAQTAASS